MEIQMELYPSASSASQSPPDQTPAWYSRFQDMYVSAAGICFLLYGDIHGIAAQDASHLFFLQKALAKSFDIVVYYHRAAGICFPLDEFFHDQTREHTRENSTRERAKALLGGFGASASPDPYTAALEASGVLSPQEDVFHATRKPRQVLAVLEQLLRADDAKRRVALILDDADYLCPPTDIAAMSADALDVLATLRFWGTDAALSAQGNPVFLLTRQLSLMHQDIRDSASGYKTISIDLPDEHARLAYITWYQQHRLQQDRPPIPLHDLSPVELARQTAGVTLRDVEDILLLGAVETPTRPVGVTRALVKSSKDAIITATYGEIVSMLDPLPGGFADLGGMDHLLALTQNAVIAPLREGRQQDVLSRMLLAGPPGTGKTYYVQALAREIGFSALALRMENILEKWVGASERNLNAFFQFARALAPVLIFLDEADQSDLSRRGTASGNPAAANLFSSMLRFAGDPALQGGVILVLASNRPDLFDPALLRRMDAIIPVLLADERGRARIIEKLVEVQGTRITPPATALLAQNTDRYSASDLAAVVREARWQAASTGEPQIEREHAERACSNLRPAVREQAEWFTLKAIDACNNLRFCPPEYAALWRNRGALRDTIKEKEKSFQTGPRQARSL